MGDTQKPIAHNGKSEADIVIHGIMRNLSPAQKWDCVVQLRETAWQLKKAGVKAEHPEWSEEDVEKEVRKIFLYAVS